MNKTEKIILGIFVLIVIIMLISIYNKRKKEAALKTADITPGMETISYRLSTNSDPSVFGPTYWEALHSLVAKIPCGTCEEFAVKFMIFFHDLVNLKLHKPLSDPTNFSEMSQLITTINLKGNKWPE